MIFGKYLKEEKTENGKRYYWHRVEFMTILLLVLTPMLIAYGIFGLMGYENMGSLKVIPLQTGFAAGYWGIIILFAIILVFNRRSVLHFSENLISFRKHPITSRLVSFYPGEISRIEKKLQKNYGETEAGLSTEIFTLIVYLKNGRRIKLGSFNEEDSSRLIQEFKQS